MFRSEQDPLVTQVARIKSDKDKSTSRNPLVVRFFVVLASVWLVLVPVQNVSTPFAS